MEERGNRNISRAAFSLFAITALVIIIALTSIPLARASSAGIIEQQAYSTQSGCGIMFGYPCADTLKMYFGNVTSGDLLVIAEGIEGGYGYNPEVSLSSNDSVITKLIGTAFNATGNISQGSYGETLESSIWEGSVSASGTANITVSASSAMCGSICYIGAVVYEISPETLSADAAAYNYTSLTTSATKTHPCCEVSPSLAATGGVVIGTASAISANEPSWSAGSGYALSQSSEPDIQAEYADWLGVTNASLSNPQALAWTEAAVAFTPPASTTTVTLTVTDISTVVSTATSTATLPPSTSTQTVTATSTATVTDTSATTATRTSFSTLTSTVTGPPSTTTSTQTVTSTLTSTVTSDYTATSVSTIAVKSTLTSTVIRPPSTSTETVTSTSTSTVTDLRTVTTTSTATVVSRSTVIPSSTLTTTVTMTSPQTITSNNTLTLGATFTKTQTVTESSYPSVTSLSILVYVYDSGGVAQANVPVTIMTNGSSSKTLSTNSTGMVTFTDLSIGGSTTYTVHASVDGTELSAPVHFLPGEGEASVVLEPSPPSTTSSYASTSSPSSTSSSNIVVLYEIGAAAVVVVVVVACKMIFLKRRKGGAG